MREYPRRSLTAAGLLLMAGLAEGIGVLSLLPVLGVAAGEDPSAQDDGMSRLLVDLLQTMGIPTNLTVLLALIVVGVAGKSLLTMLAMSQAGLGTADMAADLRRTLMRAWLRARWGFFVTQQRGAMANAVSGEATRASQTFVRSTNLLANAIQVIVYCVLAVLVSPFVTLFAVATGALMTVAFSRLVQVGRRSGEVQTSVQRSLVERLADTLGVIKPLKAMGLEQRLEPILDAEAGNLREAQRTQTITQAALPAAHEILSVCTLAIVVFVAIEVSALPLEQLVFLAFLFQRTVARMGSLQVDYQMVADVESALWAIEESIKTADMAREDTGGSRQPRLERSLEIRDVTFKYETSSGPVLHKFSLELQAGQTGLIIGGSGAGKTTIADLVIGLYRPTLGDVFLDGIPLKEVDLHAWRTLIGYVPQEISLFHDTVLANITLGDPNISERDVLDALKEADALDFVNRLPDGLHTSVGESGLRLSGGQRQRLAIARALVRGPKLLVLDEATSGLDPRTEEEILRVVSGLSADITVLAIAHREAFTEIADVVIDLDFPTGPATEIKVPND